MLLLALVAYLWRTGRLRSLRNKARPCYPSSEHREMKTTLRGNSIAARGGDIGSWIAQLVASAPAPLAHLIKSPREQTGPALGDADDDELSLVSFSQQVVVSHKEDERPNREKRRLKRAKKMMARVAHGAAATNGHQPTVSPRSSQGGEDEERLFGSNEGYSNEGYSNEGYSNEVLEDGEESPPWPLQADNTLNQAKAALQYLSARCRSTSSSLSSGARAVATSAGERAKAVSKGAPGKVQARRVSRDAIAVEPIVTDTPAPPVAMTDVAARGAAESEEEARDTESLWRRESRISSMCWLLEAEEKVDAAEAADKEMQV